MDSDGQLTSEEYGTMDDDVMDKPGGTCLTDTLVPEQPQSVPSEPARLQQKLLCGLTFPIAAGSRAPRCHLLLRALVHHIARSQLRPRSGSHKP